MVATYNSMPGMCIHVKDAHTMATNDVGTISPNRSTLVSVTRPRPAPAPNSRRPNMSSSPKLAITIITSLFRSLSREDVDL
jgi:hypothetical protein